MRALLSGIVAEQLWLSLRFPRLGTNVEGSRLLFDVNDEQVVESLVIGWQLESLPRREDGDVRYAVSTLTCAVAAKGDRGIGRKEVACKVSAEASRDGNDWRTIGHTRIRVVNDHRMASGERLGDQLLLAALRLAVVPHDVLADKVVRAGKALAIERRLAGTGQADQDDAFHVCDATG